MRDIVSVRQGKVRGMLCDGVYVFKGIPYAAAPFGAFRFLAPQPRAPWDHVRDASAYGPKPPQVPYPAPLDAIFPAGGDAGEDCLNLNIWAPDLDAGGRPVMVWIAGGEFEHAASADYDGSRFARDGIVCVSINYRVGGGWISVSGRWDRQLRAARSGRRASVGTGEYRRLRRGSRQRHRVRPVGGCDQHRDVACNAGRARAVPPCHLPERGSASDLVAWGRATRRPSPCRSAWCGPDSSRDRRRSRRSYTAGAARTERRS